MAYADSLSPTFIGHIATLYDARLLVECCVRGIIKPIHRRLHDFEQGELIRDGSVFVFEEESSNIKRWTDGRTWSTSRKVGDFFVYQEKTLTPKKESKRTKNNNRGINKPELNKRALGSLVGFGDSMHQGLMKKSVAVTRRSLLATSRYHIISYYIPGGAGRLNTPSGYPLFQNIQPRSDLVEQALLPPIASAPGSHTPYLLSNGRPDDDSTRNGISCHHRQEYFPGGRPFHDTLRHHQSGRECQLGGYPSTQPLHEASGGADVPKLPFPW